jgi:hypothetical protein
MDADDPYTRDALLRKVSAENATYASCSTP